jgi:hypothetical protein
MNLIFLDRDCIRERSSIAGGVMESGIVGIVVFLRAALDRVAIVTHVWCTWRFAQDSFRMAEYSPRWGLLDIVSNICTIRLRWDLSGISSIG